MAIAAPTTASRRAPAPTHGRPRRRPRHPLFLLIPAVVILLFGIGYPVVWQIVTSFQKYGARCSSSAQPPDFVGLDNYIALATDPTLWIVVGALDRLLHRHRPRHRGHRHAARRADERRCTAAVRIVLQVALLLAWAMPVVAAMTVWIWLVRLAPRRRELTAGPRALGRRHRTATTGSPNPLSFFVVAVGHRRLDERAVRRALGLRRPHPGLGEVLEAAAARRRQRLAAAAAHHPADHPPGARRSSCCCS